MGNCQKVSDRGKTWSYLNVSNDGEFLRVASVEVVSGDNDTIYAGICYGTGSGAAVVKARDNGGDFSALSFEILHESSVPVNTVRVSPADSEIVFAGTGYFYAPETAGGYSEVLTAVIPGLKYFQALLSTRSRFLQLLLI